MTWVDTLLYQYLKGKCVLSLQAHASTLSFYHESNRSRIFGNMSVSSASSACLVEHGQNMSVPLGSIVSNAACVLHAAQSLTFVVCGSASLYALQSLSAMSEATHLHIFITQQSLHPCMTHMIKGVT